jgi:hypothetical protein
MTNDEKDAVCELWIEVFGTQEGTGYNCPAGAYTFAEVVAALATQGERERCAKVCEELARADFTKDPAEYTEPTREDYAAAIRGMK